MPPAAEGLQGADVAPASTHYDLRADDLDLPRVSSATSCLDVTFSLSRAGPCLPGLSAGKAIPTMPAAPLQDGLAIKGTPRSPSASKEPRRPATWQIEPSDLSLRTVNPIRRITDAAAPAAHQAEPGRPKKSTISLGQGDPTVFGHVAVGPEAAEAVIAALKSGKFNGYTPSFGLGSAREAVAHHLSCWAKPHAQYSPQDIYITSGCGHSVQIVVEALSNPGKNILLPRPGFPVYDCWCAAAGLEIRRYSLMPDRDWEVDLGEVDALADENTVALVICNPGNPAGNVFSRRHLEEVAAFAHSLKLPIIADEIYEGITFAGGEYTPLAAVVASMVSRYTPSIPEIRPNSESASAGVGEAGAADVASAGPGSEGADVICGRSGGTGQRDDISSGGAEGGAQEETFLGVPVITVSSISKTLLVPGWRLGWIALHDPRGILKGAKLVQAIENRLQFTPPSCALIQAAVGDIFASTKPESFTQLNRSLEASLNFSLKMVASIPGLDCPSTPKGGMFLMVRVNLERFSGFASDVEWCRALFDEESVVVIPGTAFEFPGWFRTLLAAPLPVLEEAWQRIASFCTRHCSKQ